LISLGIYEGPDKHPKEPNLVGVTTPVGNDDIRPKRRTHHSALVWTGSSLRKLAQQARKGEKKGGDNPAELLYEQALRLEGIKLDNTADFVKRLNEVLATINFMLGPINNEINVYRRDHLLRPQLDRSGQL